MAAHKIRWYVRVTPCEEAPDGYLRHTAHMRGQWGYDVRCSCGWDSKTGGAVRSFVRRLIEEHRFEAKCQAEEDEQVYGPEIDALELAQEYWG